MPEEKSGLRPYVVDFVVTYRNSILVYAENHGRAVEHAAALYESGEYDPERNGYDGVEITAVAATPKDVETYQWDTYYAIELEGEDE